MTRHRETVVIDMNTILELVTRGGHSLGLRMWLETAELIYAADQMHISLADYFRDMVVREKISGKAAAETCAKSLEIVDHFVSTASLWQEALFESLKFRLTVREMIPLILARKINAAFLSPVEQKNSIAQALGIKIY